MRKIALILLMIILALPVYAQDKPDFSGIWTIDKEKTQMPDTGRRRMSPPEKVMITQKGKDIKIETVHNFRGEDRSDIKKLEIGAKEKKIESMMFRGRQEGEPPVTMAKAEWDKSGKSLVVTANTTGTFRDQEFSWTTITTYSLSNNSKTLTVHNKMSSRRGDMESTLVYNKAE